jgi:lipid A 3-O-deacylase
VTQGGRGTSRSVRRTWGIGLLAAAVALLSVTLARAETPLTAGTKALGLGGAISLSYNTQDNLDQTAGIQLLPHVGYVLTEPLGPKWVRGNLEVLLEPVLLHLETDHDSATVLGASAIARWLFTGSGRFRPYLEAGAGILLGEIALRQTDCDVNFLLQGGPGLLVFLSDQTTFTVGYRLQHISNGGACHFNTGINSNALYLGIGYFFR